MEIDDELVETLEGTFKKTIYRSSNYMVSVLETSDGPITVTGPSFDYENNCKYSISGKYVDHPKYGFQFEMMSITKYLPSAKEEIIKYLSSPIFKKVGPKAAEKIYSVYGDETLRIIKNDLSALDEVNISELQRQSIKDVFMSDQDATSDSLFKLIELGFNSREAHLIYTHFKEELLDIVKENPYRFYLEVYGINLKRVYECCKNIDFEDKETKFKIAYLVSIFKQISFNLGDTYLLEDDFRYLYDKEYPDFEEILLLTIENSYLVLDENRIYLKSDYEDENYIANYLNTHDIDDLHIDEVNLGVAIEDSAEYQSISYDIKQKEAIKNFFDFGISMVVGGPGTGKTTIIKEMVELFTNYFPYNNIIVAAPTGRAAKRITEICNVTSKTIHSLLRWNKEDNTFAFDEKNPLTYDAIIIDEFSMVDNGLFAALLKASSRVKKICIIGDDNQLPSIRQGNVLFDLIHSKKFPLVRLETIHRQKEGNEIIEFANDIVKNDVSLDKFTSDVEFIDIKNFKKDSLVDLINTNIDDGYSFDNIQVLAPMYRGEFGIDALNLSLQNSFNPKDKNKLEKRIADCLYRETDKILQLKNRPDDDVYNGDIGILEEIDMTARTFLINYNDVYIYYSFDDLVEISLAYALTVHKSQGSEYEIVYFLCAKEHYSMLYKKLIYTAISRAKNKLVIIGDKHTFINATKRDIKQRKTHLIERLRTNQ